MSEKMGWEERLKTLIGGYCWAQDGGNGGFSWDDVKDFIRSTIAEATKRARLDLVLELEKDTNFLSPIIGFRIHNKHLLKVLNKLEALKSSLEEGK